MMLLFISTHEVSTTFMRICCLSAHLDGLGQALLESFCDLESANVQDGWCVLQSVGMEDDGDRVEAAILVPGKNSSEMRHVGEGRQTETGTLARACKIHTRLWWGIAMVDTKKEPRDPCREQKSPYRR